MWDRGAQVLVYKLLMKRRKFENGIQIQKQQNTAEENRIYVHSNFLWFPSGSSEVNLETIK